MEEKRLNIGLFVGNLEDEFDYAVARGAIRGSKDIDANLIIFHGKYIKAEYADKEITRYEYQKNTIYFYAKPENIDVLVVVLGTIGTMMSEKEKKAFLNHFEGIPIIFLASRVEDRPNILFDNKSGFKEGIKHIIQEHGRKSVGFVSGPLTNIDAFERKETYCEALEECGLQYEEKRVVYGNFSRYSEEIVENLLDENPDLDAIIFANDHMAIGGYNVLKKRNIGIGTDVLCMGFDDSPIAMSLSPNLTSVRADAVAMGRKAVHECKNYYETGKINDSRVGAILIKRASCGCVQRSELHADGINFERKENRSNLIDSVVNLYFAGNRKEIRYQYAKEAMHTFVRTLFTFLDDSYYSEKDRKVIIGNFERMLASDMQEYISMGELLEFLDIVKSEVSKLPNVNQTDVDEIFVNLYRQMVSYSVSGMEDYQLHMDWINWIANSISRDMLVYEATDDMSYSSIMEKLRRLDITRSYLYVYDKPILVTEESVFEFSNKTDRIKLKAYYDGVQSFIVPAKEQVMSLTEVLSNKFLPQNESYAFVLSALYSNEEQYGIVLCELETQCFAYLNMLVNQLSAALKIMVLLRQREAIQQKLQDNLQFIKESNLVLEALSKSDELTGIYNRRGFFDLANTMIKNKRNEGKSALLIYADLDNLKTINDCFGHDDGDFALVSATNILKEAFRSTDVLGRIGGDEFAIFAMVNGDGIGMSDHIRQRIKGLAANFNAKSEKAYNVCISLGVTEFLCNPKVSIETYLEKADALLYEDKRKKNREVRKNVPKE